MSAPPAGPDAQVLAPRRPAGWDRRTRTGLERVTEAVLAAAGPRPGVQVIDLGCADGRLSVPLAESGASVLAVDVSQAMVARLKETAIDRSITGLRVLAAPLPDLRLPAASADIVVSCYALHRLRDPDKARVLAAAYEWLRPGGELVVADMMFGRGATSKDRAIIRFKIRALARKGIGGWWRIAKNGYRYLVRAKDYPVSISTWAAMLARAGFTGITASSVFNEAGLVSGRRPETS
ncbi:MAG TPA: methyltransferase domain-containing protein [Streptosporangiaceae bacterium]|nr:methyltransferase domain-containing protein [Streptosporangiaceae bacterium]